MLRLKHFLASLALALLSVAGAYAISPVTRDISVSVELLPQGGANVSETWNLCTTEGTEWYLPRYNLGEIDIRDFTVKDETGLQFNNIGTWEVNRSMADKAGKCGMVRANGGYELCWGVGSYGDHIFTAQYRMTNVVQGLDDYDFLHIQFVSQGVKPRPRHASVVITLPGVALDSTNCAIWAFGFNGTISFKDGRIEAETLEPFHSDKESVIILARFAKGLIVPSVNNGGLFEEKLETAFKGSSYQEYLDNEASDRRMIVFMALFTLAFSALMIYGAIRHVRQRNLNMFGVKKLNEIGYERDVPFGGNLFESRHVLKRVGYDGGNGGIAGAVILRMIYKGFLSAVTDNRGKVEISFNQNADLEALSPAERELYNMMKEASGADNILQDKEFSRWSRKHTERVSKWCDKVDAEGRENLRRDGFTLGTSFSPEGKIQARRVIGLRKFLKEFTLIDERSVPEVVLWQEYLVFAALLGIADKVAKQLKDIDPKQFEEVVGYEPLIMNRIIFMSAHMGASITNAMTMQTSGSVGGRGGFSSFGGGGGFSGGGFGGGAR